jgi:2-succinyl-5-enolpyruvyl-6-hydroxy-3-cyclohexene-1-carboxylate synthase
VTALLSRADVEVVALSRGPRWSDQGHRVAVVASKATVAGPDDPAWLDAWRAADAAAAEAVERVLTAAAAELPAGVLLGPLVARALSRAVPPEGLLLVGSSHPVRDLDLVAAPYPVGERRLVTANRGLSGIDGAISTALGLALVRRSSRSLALLGDLTFQHDVGGLILGPQEPRPELTVVVANDDGGSIFATLEPGRNQYTAAFERLFATPTGVDLRALCAAANVAYRRVPTMGQLADELEQPPGGVRVLEARVDRSRRAELAASVRAAVATAVSTR